VPRGKKGVILKHLVRHMNSYLFASQFQVMREYSSAKIRFCDFEKVITFFNI